MLIVIFLQTITIILVACLFANLFSHTKRMKEARPQMVDGHEAFDAESVIQGAPPHNAVAYDNNILMAPKPALITPRSVDYAPYGGISENTEMTRYAQE